MIKFLNNKGKKVLEMNDKGELKAFNEKLKESLQLDEEEEEKEEEKE